MSASSQPRVQHLTPEEERALSERWRVDGDVGALARMVKSHIGLVVSIAKEFQPHERLTFDDIVQEGHVGLMQAARRFDAGKNARLATYATYWIRAMILNAIINTHGPVRIGTARADRKIFFGLGKARKRLEREGKPVDREHLAEALEVEIGRLEGMEVRMSGRDCSLDAPLGDDGSDRQGDRLVDLKPSPEDQAVAAASMRDAKRRVQAALKLLDRRERLIIRWRYLREGSNPPTLARIGRRLGISRERVRQIELRAKKKLREFIRQAR